MNRLSSQNTSLAAVDFVMLNVPFDTKASVTNTDTAMVYLRPSTSNLFKSTPKPLIPERGTQTHACWFPIFFFSRESFFTMK